MEPRTTKSIGKVKCCCPLTPGTSEGLHIQPPDIPKYRKGLLFSPRAPKCFGRLACVQPPGPQKLCKGCIVLAPGRSQIAKKRDLWSALPKPSHGAAHPPKSTGAQEAPLPGGGPGQARDPDGEEQTCSPVDFAPPAVAPESAHSHAQRSSRLLASLALGLSAHGGSRPRLMAPSQRS